LQPVLEHCAVARICPTEQPNRLYLTNCKHKSLTWEANSRSASQEIPRLSRNLKATYSVHRGPPLVPTLGQMNNIYTLNNSSFTSIHLVPRSKEWSYTPTPPVRLHGQGQLYLYTSFLRSILLWSSHLHTGLKIFSLHSDFRLKCISQLSHAYYMFHQSHTPCYERPNNIRRRVQIVMLFLMQHFLPSCYILSLRFKYSPQRTTRFQTLSSSVLLLGLIPPVQKEDAARPSYFSLLG
jgi:hypothetical protein